MDRRGAEAEGVDTVSRGARRRVAAGNALHLSRCSRLDSRFSKFRALLAKCWTFFLVAVSREAQRAHVLGNVSVYSLLGHPSEVIVASFHTLHCFFLETGSNVELEIFWRITQTERA